MKESARPIVFAALLVVVGLCVYATSLNGAFVFDDIISIVKNPSIRSFGTAFDSAAGTGQNGRPLVALSLALNHALHGLEPLGYHVFNVLVHVATALSIFGVVRRHAGGIPSQLDTRLAFAVALLFVVHPLCTDALNHVVYRNEAMMALFYVLTIYAALRGFDSARPGRWFAAASFAALCGAASKEVIVSVPLVVLLIDRQRSGETLGECLKNHAKLYAGLALSLVALAIFVMTAERGRSVGFDQESYSSLAWARTQAGVIVHYLRLVFVPHPLVLDYKGWPPATTLSSWLPQATLLSALLAAALFGVIKRRVWALPLFTFFALLAPTSSIIPITGEVVAEHRMYLPLACVLMLVVFAFGRALADRPPGLLAAAWALALPLGTLTVLRHRDYVSAEAIWRDTAEKRPDNPRAFDTLAQLMAEDGRVAEAEDAYRQAIAAAPGEGRVYYNLGVLLFESGRQSEAPPLFRKAIDLRPELNRARVNLGLALLATGDSRAARSELDRALAGEAFPPAAARALAWLCATSTDVSLRDGARARLLAERLVARTVAPVARDLDILAAAMAELGRFGEALEILRRAAAAKPQQRMRQALARHRQSYEAGRAWRE